MNIALGGCGVPIHIQNPQKSTQIPGNLHQLDLLKAGLDILQYMILGSLFPPRGSAVVVSMHACATHACTLSSNLFQKPLHFFFPPKIKISEATPTTQIFHNI